MSSTFNGSAKHFAVLRRWIDNQNDFEVVEYASSEQEAKDMIDRLPKSDQFRYEVGTYELS